MGPVEQDENYHTTGFGYNYLFNRLAQYLSTLINRRLVNVEEIAISRTANLRCSAFSSFIGVDIIHIPFDYGTNKHSGTALFCPIKFARGVEMPDPFRFLQTELSDEGVLTVSLNRLPANAVDRDMYIEIAALFGNIDRFGGDVRAVVLRGNGHHFCAGNDLDEFATMDPENGTERMWRVREAFFAIQNCVVPAIAAVHGAALGTGLCLAVSCDFVVAARDAKFGLPELTVGVMGGARHLSRIAPQPLVRRMFFTGEPLSAQDLRDAGGSIIVCDSVELDETAMKYARRVAGLSPTAVRLAKQILNRVETMDMADGYTFEQGFTVKMSGHSDSKEALRAFREKRKPEYAPRAPSWKIEA